MIRFNLNLSLFLSLFFLAPFFGALQLMAFEEPKYSVITQLEKIEVRQYSEYLVAQAEITGSRDKAGSTGFNILAAYIFGKNQGDNNLAMTAPVMQTENTQIEITDDPLSQPSIKADPQRWTVQFMMPSKYTLETLPKPKDPKVYFKWIPVKKMAAVTYSGRWTESNYQEHLDLLTQELKKAKIKSKGVPLWARYNSPFTPWFLRKNEILVEVE